jgi:hypothetical protein
VTDTKGREVHGRLERLSSDGVVVKCTGAIADDSADIDAGVECAEGFTVFPGLGALVGLAVHALIPGKVHVVYQATPRQESSRARVTVVPLFARGTRGLTLAFAF